MSIRIVQDLSDLFGKNRYDVFMRQAKPLARYPIITTNRIDEAAFKLSQTVTDVHITRVVGQKRFQLEMNGINIGRTSLVFNRFGAETELKTGHPPTETAIIVIGNNVPSRFSTDNTQVVVSSEKAAIVAPARQICLERPANSELLVRVLTSDLMHHFEELTDRHHQGPLIFNHSIDLTRGPGAMLKRCVNHLVNELEYNDVLLENPDLLKSYDDMLLTALLSLPHNQREKLYKDRRYQVAPGLVRRAEEYMRAQLNATITITDLLQICGCSRSLLYSAFRNARGYTPMEFLTKQRLQSAREKLLKQHPDASVASIAMDCGFFHLGRFSQSYRKRFGERPSETLQKGR